MPLPASTTILLAAASISLIFGRYFHIRANWIRGLFFLVAMLLAAGSLSTDRIQVFSPADSLEARPIWNNDGLAQSEQWLVLAFGLLAGIATFDALKCEHDTSSTYGFLLFVVAGMMLVARSNDFLSLGMSFEIVNLASMALRRHSDSSILNVEVASDQRGWRSTEVWLIWLSSAGMWFGIALLLNATATTHFDVMRLVLANAYAPGADQIAVGTPSKLILLAIALIVTSLFARLGLVPFHLGLSMASRKQSHWLIGLSICGEQLAGSMILTRLIGCVFVGLGQSLTTLLMTVILATFVLSGAMAVRALSPGVRSIPRWVASLVLLQDAWLGVGLMVVATELQHPGVRWGAFTQQNESLALVVLTQLSSLLASGGVYWTLGHLARADREVEFLEDMKGLWKLAPTASIALIVALVSVIGFPLTAGFWIRWLTLLAGHNVHLKSTSNIFAPNEGLRVVMIVGTIATMLFAIVVIRLSREMFLESPLARPKPIGGRGLLIASVIAAIGSILIGVAPELVLFPLRTISPPRNVVPKGVPRGSGMVPLGLKSGSEIPILIQAPVHQ